MVQADADMMEKAKELGNMPAMEINEDKELTPEEFRRQWIKACNGMRSRLLLREEMFEKRWEAEHAKLAEAACPMLPAGPWHWLRPVCARRRSVRSFESPPP